MIKSGFNGYLVEPGDPVVLANSLLAALSDDATSVSCADAALETIRRNYTWRRVVESLSTVYDEIIAEKRQGEIRATLPRDSGAGGRPPRAGLRRGIGLKILVVSSSFFPKIDGSTRCVYDQCPEARRTGE